MIDYSSLRAVALVVQTGSFEKAARALHVTPSAVSQRVKQIEERLGAALVVRGAPCVATETRLRLCRHMEQVGLLEQELLGQLPGLAAAGPQLRASVPVAVNADSLGTWFLEAAAAFHAATGHLLAISVDDQDHTADWLREGRVLAAVTGLGRPAPGCRTIPLGALRYHATASPAFVARHFPAGVTAEALAAAPVLTYDRKDGLQAMWIERLLGRAVAGPTHWLPSTQGFVEAALRGMGWGLNPAALAAPHLAAGRLAELVPGAVLDVPLHWQANRLAGERLAPLTRAVTAAGRRALVQGEG